MNRSLPSPFRTDRPIVVGMVHLLPLPGSPGWGGSLDKVIESARRDAFALLEGGVDALMLENFHDVPFFKTKVPAVTVATITRAALALCDIAAGGSTPVPVGVNVLRNDGRSALAVAVASGCSFIRVNVLCGARVTDQGTIEGIAARLMRDRASLGAADGVGNVRVWADVDVKHSAPLAPRPIEEEVADTLVRGRADALIVSGGGTGKSTDPQKLQKVKAVAGTAPVLVGSGITAENAGDFADADGFIVGTSLQAQGRVEAARVRTLVEATARLSRSR